MPASRARTAICSAPFEWPSRPGLPTRILIAPARAPRTPPRRGRAARSATRRRAPARRRPTPVGARYSPNDLAQRGRPLAGGHAGLARTRASRASRSRRAPRAAARELLERVAPRRPRRGRRATARTASIGPRSTASSTRMIPPSSPSCSGEGSALVNTFCPTTLSSPRLDPRTRSRCDSTSWVFMYGTASTAPPCSATTAISSRAPSTSSADEPLHHLGALEDVGVVEQVGLVGQDLLDAQRPLLVPRPRQPERLVPGRQLRSRGRARRAPMVTASASSTMRMMLFSGWASVSPSELT